MASRAATLFMQAASKPLMDDKNGKDKSETIISKLDKEAAAEEEKEKEKEKVKTEDKAEDKGAIVPPEVIAPSIKSVPETTATIAATLVTAPGSVQERVETAPKTPSDTMPVKKANTVESEIAHVKPGKRRPQSMRKNEVGIRSMDKTDIPEGDKNLTTSRSFSIDMETSERLDAAAKVLQRSGAVVDGRPVSPSALVRIALKRELDRISKENGEAFDKAVLDEMNRSDNAPMFKL